MKRCKGFIPSTLIFNISYSFAAIALQLLLFSYINQAFCGKPAATILLPASTGDGKSCIFTMRNTPPSKHSFDDVDKQARGNPLPSLNEASRTFDERGPKQQSLRVLAVKSHHHAGRRRGLISGGIGSTPPKCISKCGKCTPCKAVRVPIQPGRTKVSLMEYYPEAWRCKCKNKLYMP